MSQNRNENQLIEFSDAEWDATGKIIEEVEERARSVRGLKRRRPRADARAVWNGIFWVMRRNATWRMMPDSYPPHQTCNRWLTDWANPMKKPQPISLMLGFFLGEKYWRRLGERATKDPAAPKLPLPTDWGTMASFVRDKVVRGGYWYRTDADVALHLGQRLRPWCREAGMIWGAIGLSSWWDEWWSGMRKNLIHGKGWTVIQGKGWRVNRKNEED